MFIKMVVFYLIMRVLIIDVYAIYVSLNGSFCANYAATHTTETCVTILSAYNLKATADQNYLNIIDILSLVFTILSIVYFIIYRKVSLRLQNWLDYNDVSQ
jgi:hypothetical protein